MQFKQEAAVISADGQKVGHLARVVIDPRSNEITHLVVHQGVLFTEDKLIPISLVASAVEERVTRREAAKDLESLTDFEQTHFVPLNQEEAARYPWTMAPSVYWS